MISWNSGDNRKVFLKLKSKLRLYLVVLTTPKTSPEKLTLTVVEMQQLPDIEKTDSKGELSCLKWTHYNDRRKVCVKFQKVKTSWILSCTVIETVYTSKIKKLISKKQNISHFWQNELISRSTLTYFTSGALYWMKQLFIINTNSVEKGCFFLMSNFRLYTGLKMSFEHNSVRKNRFQSARFWWDCRFFYVRWTKNSNLVEPLVMRTRTWSFFFVISKCLDYMQYYMTLQEQCGHIVLKDLATVERLDEDQIHVCSVTWLYYSFAFKENSFCPLFSTLSIFEAVCLALY